MNRSRLLAALAPLLLVTGCLDSGGGDGVDDTATIPDAQADTAEGTDTLDALEDARPSTCDEMGAGETCVGTVSCYSSSPCWCNGGSTQSGCACVNGRWLCVIDDSCYFACSGVDVVDADSGPDVADSAEPPDSAEPSDTAGPTDASAPDATDPCPAAAPGFEDSCTSDGLQCDFGQECCCGACYPSLSCTCSGGSWACFATDACFHPACAGCDAARDALAATLYTKQLGFTVVVRLDHASLDVLGYTVVAGAYGGVDEATARATAQAATGFGAQGMLLSGADPVDDWVFYQSPGDFGGVGVVSARTGLAVFGGSVIWSGSGDITWPTSWSPASDLASGCASTGGFGTTRGFDLVTGGALSSADVDAVLAEVAATAVLPAIWQGGYAFDAVVLRYPRSVGVFDPTTAEWIVLVSGGWLE
ncbi:MAG: hypothetical protein CVU56_10795 [Deltaproteobacteria bacterium HGW-Deltaproteobacteria-14]|jgi:hypothetical protein|nr:MAG: hypothetical protein CVU56_10795 [Deltaproteobacteria bacterium HGW-Deltaproteobacteria-14]